MDFRGFTCKLTIEKMPSQLLITLWLIGQLGSNIASSSTTCNMQRIPGRYFFLNHTLNCPMRYQWTVADWCCYESYDTYLRHPYCCYSEVYKLAVAVGFICLILLGTTFTLFFCWFYNIPHHLLYILTLRKFKLNDWLDKARNGPYVDPSFYSGEPFWARGAEQHMPLRPMPPRIFYPAPPSNVKFRWEMGPSEMPLFVLASRQFNRNPYSARPAERTPSHDHRRESHAPNSNQLNDSRRSSITSAKSPKMSRSAKKVSNDRDSGRRARGSISSTTNRVASGVGFANKQNMHEERLVVNLDEEEATAELLDALKIIEERSTENSPMPDTEDEIKESKSLEQNAVASQTEYSMRRQSGPKISMQRLNQQLSTGITLSISNLPNIHVVGDFGEGMEVIAEDDIFDICDLNEDDCSEKETIADVPGGSTKTTSSTAAGASTSRNCISQGKSLISSSPLSKKNSLDTCSSAERDKPRSNSVFESSSCEGSRIASAFDRMVTTRKQEVPFVPSLPGAVPDDVPKVSRKHHAQRRPRAQLRHKQKVNRRNSAPNNF